MSVAKNALKALVAAVLPPMAIGRLRRRPVKALIARIPTLMKYIPYPAPKGMYVLRKSNNDVPKYEKYDFPIPHESLLDDSWLTSGKKDVDTMMRILHSAEFSIQPGNRILDFGCSTGRMIRWFADLAEETEIWGVDINARDIVWCQENLTPPFNFATVTIEPHLPFKDE